MRGARGGGEGQSGVLGLLEVENVIWGSKKVGVGGWGGGLFECIEHAAYGNLATVSEQCCFEVAV